MATDAGTGPQWRRGEEPEFTRILAFTDAIFAIAMTLLALDLRVDRVVGDASSPAAMWQALDDLSPQLIAFLVAFYVLARYWRQHHLFMSRVAVIDSRMLTINLVYLAFVAVLPLPTSLIGEYEQNPVSGVLFALTLATIAVLETLQLAHAQRSGLLRRDGAAPDDDRSAQEQLVDSIAPAVTFLVTMPLSFIDPTLMLASWAVVGPGAGWLRRRRQRRRATS